ncbi:hypothetical protein DFH06DRAFT_1149733 [Mycena polygramma]|nr:hypothetical protein DFH06DRAFT_1149733 [Mycena polygramma]
MYAKGLLGKNTSEASRRRNRDRRVRPYLLDSNNVSDNSESGLSIDESYTDHLFDEGRWKRRAHTGGLSTEPDTRDSKGGTATVKLSELREGSPNNSRGAVANKSGARGDAERVCEFCRAQPKCLKRLRSVFGLVVQPPAQPPFRFPYCHHLRFLFTATTANCEGRHGQGPTRTTYRAPEEVWRGMIIESACLGRAGWKVDSRCKTEWFFDISTRDIWNARSRRRLPYSYIANAIHLILGAVGKRVYSPPAKKVSGALAVNTRQACDHIRLYIAGFTTRNLRPGSRSTRTPSASDIPRGRLLESQRIQNELTPNFLAWDYLRLDNASFTAKRPSAGLDDHPHALRVRHPTSKIARALPTLISAAAESRHRRIVLHLSFWLDNHPHALRVRHPTSKIARALPTPISAATDSQHRCFVFHLSFCSTDSDPGGCTVSSVYRTVIKFDNKDLRRGLGTTVREYCTGRCSGPHVGITVLVALHSHVQGIFIEFFFGGAALE